MKQLAILISISTISTSALVFSNFGHSPAAAQCVQVSIRNGRFHLPNVRQSEQLIELSVSAGKPINVTFLSHDFVYTVELKQKHVAVVVLPHKTATMTLNLESGRWPIMIVQGCGRLFAGHEEQLMVRATE